MIVDNKALVLALVEWMSRKPRPYAEALGAWQTSCAKLTIWEDAVELGFVTPAYLDGEGAIVEVTPRGLAFLRSERCE